MQKQEKSLILYKKIQNFYYPWLTVFLLKNKTNFIYNNSFYKFTRESCLDLYNFQLSLLDLNLEKDSEIDKYALMRLKKGDNFLRSLFYKDIISLQLWFKNIQSNFLKKEQRLNKYLKKIIILKKPRPFFFNTKKKIKKKYKTTRLLNRLFVIKNYKRFKKKSRYSKKFKIYLQKLYLKKLYKKNKIYFYLLIYRRFYRKFYKFNLKIYKEFYKLNLQFWNNLFRSIRVLEKSNFIKKIKKNKNKSRAINILYNNKMVNNIDQKILLFYTLSFLGIKNINLTVYENFFKFDYNKFKNNFLKFFPRYFNYLSEMNILYKDFFYNCFIRKTKSNLFITVTNRLGDVLLTFSAGQLDLFKKKKKRKTIFVWSFLIKKVAYKLRLRNIFKLYKLIIQLKFRRFTWKVQGEFLKYGVQIKKIFYDAKRTHGLKPRSKKIRRI